MNLPIDTSAITVLGAGAPEVIVDFITRNKQKRTLEGKTLYSVTGRCLRRYRCGVISVRVPGEPKGIAKNIPVHVTGSR